MRAYLRACEGQSSMLSFFFNCILLYFWGRVSPWTWSSLTGLDLLASSPGFFLPSPFLCWGYRHVLHLAFYLGAGVPNSGPFACAASMSLTEQTLAPEHSHVLDHILCDLCVWLLSPSIHVHTCWGSHISQHSSILLITQKMVFLYRDTPHSSYVLL